MLFPPITIDAVIAEDLGSDFIVGAKTFPDCTLILGAEANLVVGLLTVGTSCPAVFLFEY